MSHEITNTHARQTDELMTNPLLDVSFCFLQVKVTQELKNTHTEQTTRLHFKHQTECDLLEDMRYEHICITCVYQNNVVTILIHSPTAGRFKI